MELALVVLCWTAAACLVLLTIMVGGYIAALTSLANARTTSENRLHR